MIHGMTRWGSLVGSLMIAIGCGGSPKSAASAPGGAASASSSAPADAAAPAPAAGASAAAPSVAGADQPSSPAPASSASVVAAPAPAAPPAHPFASNAVEATSLIDDAITSRANELDKCVESARTRRKSVHEKLVVEVGIDEEGHMLGVKLPKSEKPDKAFTDCVLAALHGAPFPRSHAGVITVRKTFEDKAVYR